MVTLEQSPVGNKILGWKPFNRAEFERFLKNKIQDYEDLGRKTIPWESLTCLDGKIKAIKEVLEEFQKYKFESPMKIAKDAIDLFLEYREAHGYSEDEAKLKAINEFWEWEIEKQIISDPILFDKI